MSVTVCTLNAYPHLYVSIYVNFGDSCSISLSVTVVVKCMNEYLAIDSGYLYKQPLRINCSMAGCFLDKLRKCFIEQGSKV